METTANAVEEYPNKENIMKMWKDCTTEDAIVVPEKATWKSSNFKQ